MEDKTHKNFDQVFRDKLQNHEVTPPAHIWEGIEAGALGATAARYISWRWWAAAGVLALILGTSSYFYFSSDSSETEKSLSKQNIETVDSQVQESATPEITSSDHMEVSEEVEQEIIEEINNNSPVEEQMNHVNESKKVDLVQKSSEPTVNESVEIDEETNIESIDRTFEGEFIESQNALVKVHSEYNVPKNSNTQRASKAGYDFFDDDVTEDIVKGHNDLKRWELGIEFSPEWISIPKNDNNIKAYGLDFSARYYFSKWFIESGIGASLSKDDGIYKVDTISQFKGSYWDVYEVTFEENNGEVIPTYHTSLKNVYENIDTNYVSRTKNDYIYLNIPLNIGYSTKLGDKFAVYFKTGIINSFKIYENIPEFQTVEESEQDIIHSEARYFNRTSWNMQATINVGLNYYLTDKFIFGIEPNARYYIKSLVEDNTGGNPYGFGVKIGFKYVIKK